MVTDSLFSLYLPMFPRLMRFSLPFSFLYFSQFLLLQALQTYSDDVLSSETHAKIDPTAGPRLITRRRHPSSALGYRRDDLEMATLDPDLENDDFFVRKMGAFHANPCVLRVFEDFRRFSEYEDPIERDIILQSREGELVLPDLERDDMIIRRIPAQKKEVPLSGAPDRYQPVPFPEPWTLPPEIQAKFLCMLERTSPSKEQSSSCRVIVPSHRQKKDDMLIRKIQSWKLGTVVPPISFTPGPCSEADLQKWEAIREASRRRHRKRLMVERLECVSARNLLVLVLCKLCEKVTSYCPTLHVMSHLETACKKLFCCEKAVVILWEKVQFHICTSLNHQLVCLRWCRYRPYV